MQTNIIRYGGNLWRGSVLSNRSTSGGGKLAGQVNMIFQRRGRISEDIARKAVLNEKAIDEPVRSALVYFLDETWSAFQYPVLISLACEAVGGDPATTSSLGAAVLLLAGAADLHDDIIDQSTEKGEKPTVLAKFGRDLTLLSGDALLFRGLTLLNDSCSRFTKRQRDVIVRLVTNAFFELGCAEAKEACAKGTMINASDALRIIRMKASVAEANAKIGAMVGGGSREQVEALGKIGKALGFLTTLRDEFIDMYEPREIRNRFVNEVLPLPVIFALEDKKTGRKIRAILAKIVITEDDAYTLVDVVMKNVQAQKLVLQMRRSLKEAYRELKVIERNEATQNLQLALDATVEDL
jgi:geranylgeranyl diphosphate synthase type I